ncbi:MAG TPA: ABC transporter substrate-binding protein [Gemmatimonadales bacterium]|nr:ABC transporter substrate-binding protein [Gemmatimonadales bacterium]
MLSERGSVGGRGRPRGLAARAAWLLALALVACANDSRPVAIGYAFPLSGRDVVAVVRDELAALRPDRPAFRIVFDSVVPGDPADVEVERAERFAAMADLIGVVGHAGSRGSLAAAPVYNEFEVPQIVPTATSRLLSGIGPWTFPLVPNDSIEGEFIGEFTAVRLGARRVTVFYINDEYGTGLRDGVTSALDRRGVAVVDEVPFDHAGDPETLVEASIRRARPDVLVVAARQRETGRIARAAWERGVRRFVVGDGALIPRELVPLAGPAADSIYAVAFWLPDRVDSLSRAFADRYRRITREDPTPAAALARDGIMLLAEAARQVGTDRQRIRDYLRSLGRTRPPFRGVTGPISFVPGRPARLQMARLARGRPVAVVDWDPTGSGATPPGGRVRAAW